jgi:allophanate hydrolase subunit 1
VHGITTHKKAVAENLEKAKEKVSSLHEPNESNVVQIAVSYDGAWSKRGY